MTTTRVMIVALGSMALCAASPAAEPVTPSPYEVVWDTPNSDTNGTMPLGNGAVLLIALQSMLLQADGRRIYLLPAWPKAWDCEFKLHAPYNTTVDDTAITADGGDMTRVHLQLVDKNGSIIINNYEPVNFSIEGAGLLVGENPTQLMAGQCVILVRSSFEPGKMTISAEMPGIEGIGKASVSLQTVPVSGNAHVDMPKTTVKAPTGKTVMPTNLKKIQVNLPEDDFGWFVIPAVGNAEPGKMVESKPMLVAGQRQTSKLTVQGCEYRIYSSVWSSAPTDITRDDALFFRMKANKEAGQTATAEVTIQGVKRIFSVKTK